MKNTIPYKVIIDTDPGVDDALAIFLALASPELDVIGLTTIFGNADTEITTRNALVLLEIAERHDIPVAAGAANPLVAQYLGPVQHVHGTNGQGDADLPEPSICAIDITASEFIYQRALANPGEVTILAIGPLTNLATALQFHPDLAALVHQVVVMGGNALVPGNATPAAEANMASDPESADIVFGASWPVTMVGLDVTHRINLPRHLINKITRGNKPTNRHLAAALPLYQQFFEFTNGIDGIYLHDPSAVVYILNSALFESNLWPIRVETEGMSRGKTWPSLGDTDDATPEPWRNRPKVRVCTAADDRRILDIITDRLA